MPKRRALSLLLAAVIAVGGVSTACGGEDRDMEQPGGDRDTEQDGENGGGERDGDGY